MRDYRYPRGPDLQDRIEGFFKWQDLRRRNGLWPFSRSTEDSPSTVTTARDDAGALLKGVNFGSQDYLSLSTNPEIMKVAAEVIAEFGVHSAGSAALIGNTTHSVLLERKIADFCGTPEAILFPTGWAAGFGVIKGLVRSTDHVVIDALAHTCLQEGASAATKNIYLFRHNRVDECRRWLEQIRAKDTQNGVMVVTESLFSMDSDTPDIAAMQALCHEFNATLVVDVAHDLGNLGPDGGGHIGAQGMTGKVDLVMGSFSKTFGSNGGFVACRNREVKEYLRFFSPPCTFSNALSPMQAACVLKAFEIIESKKGAVLRDSLMNNILSLREQLGAAGFEVYGDPSAIVCVKVGSEALARLVSRRLPEAGLISNLVEFPAVPKGQARFRMQVMANHTPQNIRDAVAALRDAYETGCAEFEQINAAEDERPLRKIA
ncbi:MAG TPA: aminotransferase class I/II-fold pyridoxal phosphate-dependent enzyme [Phenylobacterium sp.]|nr:aminotransferase class I/II-fold pyridoxal phosphate-dependent enzyme [Phenylobacterium sp.]